MSSRIALAAGLATLFAATAAESQDWFRKMMSRPQPANTPPAIPVGNGERPNRPAQLDSEIEFPLGKNHGPALVFVASYVGSPSDGGRDALTYANNLARELRNRLKLSAYVYKDQAKTEYEQPSEQQVAAWKKEFAGAKPRFLKLQTPPALNYCVVVGDFPTIDCRAIDSTMNRLRKLKPTDLAPEVARELRWRNDVNQSKHSLVGVRAVLNPERDKTPPRPTKEMLAKLKMLKKLNDDEPYSVYQLRTQNFGGAAPTTICVKTFRGLSAVDGTKGGAGKIDDGLRIAGQNAQVLVNALRNMGVQAFIFHGESGSMVMVGSYRGLDDPRLPEDVRKLSGYKVTEGLTLEPQVIPIPADPSVILNQYAN